MLRSTRTRRAFEPGSSMATTTYAASASAMPHAATGLRHSSSAERRKLAAPAVLLGGNRPRSREPPERVPMETWVLRRLRGVKPLVSLLGTAVLEARDDCCRHTIDEMVDE